MNNLARTFVSQYDRLVLDQRQMVDSVVAAYGSADAFRQQLEYRIVDSVDDPDFAAIYSLYQTYFPIPEERESFEGFARSMAFNDSSDAEGLGVFREEWISVYSSLGELLGSVNFSYYYVSDERGGFVTVHIAYLFVHHLYRSLGLASALLDRVRSRVQDWISVESLSGVGDRIYLFCEQNSPEMMSLADYFVDAQSSMLDPCQRLVWWCRRGYRRLMVNYVQPALDSDSDACLTLTINVCSVGDSLPGYILKEHLRRFYIFSVFKGDVDLVDVPEITLLFDYLEDNDLSKDPHSLDYYNELKEQFYCSDPHHIPVDRLYPQP